MNILVDTSVWIGFLSNRAPYARELDALLSRDEVSGHAFVYGELLIGDKGGRGHFLASYSLIHQAPVVPHADIVSFVRLASSLVGRLKLWTVDPRLAALAGDLRIAYS